MEEQQRTPRLCSEIQLFDLCELDACPHKEGRFCTHDRILDRFEAIKEEDERALHYLPDEFEEDEEGADDADEFGGEDEYEDDEI
jgi:hypothetical protein